MVQLSNLRVEYDPHPVAVDRPNPRLSWNLVSDERNQFQAAYQILVASTEALLDVDSGDVWDTGKVSSNQSIHVRFEGAPLKSDTDYVWKVRVWDMADQSSSFSDTARFSTGLFHEDDWNAKWIGRGPVDENKQKCGPDFEPDRSQPMLRKVFEAKPGILRARAFICGVGFHELHVNGSKAGDHYLAPAKTDFLRQVLYETINVTDMLVEGDNAVGVNLGGGWYSTQKRHWGWRMNWYGHPRLILQLHVDYADGTRKVIVSDETWKSTTGPITTNCIFDGECYDARLEKPGWSTSSYNDSDWDGVNLVEAPAPKIVSSMIEPALAHETIRPVSMTVPQPGMYVFDMGENFTGWVKLTVEGPAGTEVVMKFAEKIHPLDAGLSVDGMIDQWSVSNNRPEDRYTLKGDGIEVYEPHFTWHGFQYVEITGFPGIPNLGTIEGKFIHTSSALTGTFECDNEFVNRIHNCTVRSQRGNLQGLPLDCPQRSERLGWLGDAHVTAEEAMMNLDMGRLYTKWLRDIKEQQREDGCISQISPRPGYEIEVTWCAAYILIPWHMFVNYGDMGVLEEHYDSQKLYMDFVASDSEGHIARAPAHGDHLSTVLGFTKGSPESMSTAFYYYDAKVMTKIATVLGHDDDAADFTALAEGIKTTFNEHYFEEETGSYADHTQMANSTPLLLGMAPDSKHDAVLQALVDDIVQKQTGHMTGGLIGTKYIVDALTANERHDIVWMLLNQTGYPSWSDLLKDDRTTLPENWNGEGSINHVVLGSVDWWFYSELAGIHPDAQNPGYEHVVIRPYVPNDLGHASASVETIRGRVASGWRKDGDKLHIDVTVPPNSRGTICVPTSGGGITEGGRKVWDDGFQLGVDGIASGQADGRYIAFETGSGSYSFDSEWR